MVSASFANEQYRNQQRKAIQRRNSYQKVIICHPGAVPPYLCLWRRNFCATGGVLFSYSGAIFERLKISFHRPRWRKTRLSCTTGFGRCDYLDFLPKRPQGTTKILGTLALAGTKTPAAPKVRSKGAITACAETPVNCPHCGQKRLGRASVPTPAVYPVLKSNGLPHSKNLPVKFGFSPKTVSANIVKKLPLQLRPKPLFIAFFSLSHKRPTFAFTGESGYTLGFRRRIAHSGLHAETGGVSDGGGITTLRAFRTFTNIPGPGIRTASFAAFGAWSGVLPKNAESLRNSDALMRVAVPRRRGPTGLRDLFSLLSKL